MNLISVVIPATSYDLNLRKCLVSLVAQKNIMLEVWVVFNPKIPQLNQSEWPDWMHFISSAKGVNCARNNGLRKSNSDYILFLDSDCELPEENHITKIFDLLLSHPLAAGVGGGYTLALGSSLSSKAYEYLQMTWLQEQILNQEMQTQALIGGHMLLRKSKLAGLEFDENIIFGGSEKEFFIRLSKINAQFYLDIKLNVIHNSFLSEKQLLKKAQAQSVGERYITSKHGTGQKTACVYLLKPSLEPSFAEYVEKYQRIFARNNQTTPSRSFIKSWLSRISEHLHIAQSKRD